MMGEGWLAYIEILLYLTDTQLSTTENMYNADPRWVCDCLQQLGTVLKIDIYSNYLLTFSLNLDIFLFRVILTYFDI